MLSLSAVKIVNRHSEGGESCVLHRKQTLYNVAVCMLYCSFTCTVGGKGCTAYDVVINPTFFESISSRELLMGFFLTVVLEGLEAKYNVTLDRRKNMSHLYVTFTCRM